MNDPSHSGYAAPSGGSRSAQDKGLPDTLGGSGPSGVAWSFFEIGLIFTLFFLLAGTPPPDVNEAHYLAKAKHYWDPNWCRGDFFLESADAHLVFYWSFGWVTRFMSLEAAAWTGRLVTWSLLAWAWVRLCAVLVPQRFFAVLTAGLFMTLLNTAQMAGEWVVGGAEAKGFAYVFVLCAMRSLALGKWNQVWLLLGIASSFHVLVGGWSVVAALVAWCFTGDRGSPVKFLVALTLGFLLALPGLVPSATLTWGTEGEVANQAARVYVFERLGHHLVFHRLPQHLVLRHGALLLASAGHRGRTAAKSAVPTDRRLCFRGRGRCRRRRCHRHRLATPADTSRVSAEILLVSAFRRGSANGRVVGQRRGTPSTEGEPVSLVRPPRHGGHHADGHRARCADSIANPAGSAARAVSQPAPGVHLSQQRRDLRLKLWRNACLWIGQNTPSDAVFLTPRYQQTFKWYANRAEAVNWKDVPQDAKGLVEWWRRMQDLHPRTAEGNVISVAMLNLKDLSTRYGFHYVLVDRARTLRRLPYPKVYPPNTSQVSLFKVYEIRPVQSSTQ